MVTLVESQRRALLEAMEEFQVIDSHEHLGPEKERVSTSVDVFTLFSNNAYAGGDLKIAGMSEAELQSLFDQDIPLDRRWSIFAPYWEQIRWGSYARAILLAIQKFYGFDDINEETYRPLSRAMQQANKPGIYDRILREACNIRKVLSNCWFEPTTKFDTPLIVPVVRVFFDTETWEDLIHPIFSPGAKIRSLDDYLDALYEYIMQMKAAGAVGLKTESRPYRFPDRAEALSAFESLRSGAQSRLPANNPIRDYVTDQVITFGVKQDLTIAVHTGYWHDFRERDPLHMIPLIQRHPDARFDIFHLGFPWIRETLMLGKGFPNVWLNLCWMHIISQRVAISALDEALDLVPVNKIIAFGGDYSLAVEKVYGHLVMARENIAQVLATRIAENRMSESQALAVARKWFWDNPKSLYGLEI